MGGTALRTSLTASSRLYDSVSRSLNVIRHRSGAHHWLVVRHSDVCNRAEIMPSVEHLLAAAGIQKLVFMDTPEEVTTGLRPYWSEATGDCAKVVQTVPDMLEIVPSRNLKRQWSKHAAWSMGITPKEIMAIGDGENDIEMLELASLGIALSNGAEKTKAVANVVGICNDEDGVANAIYRYAL